MTPIDLCEEVLLPIPDCASLSRCWDEAVVNRATRFSRGDCDASRWQCLRATRLLNRYITACVLSVGSDPARARVWLERAYLRRGQLKNLIHWG